VVKRNDESNSWNGWSFVCFLFFYFFTKSVIHSLPNRNSQNRNCSLWFHLPITLLLIPVSVTVSVVLTTKGQLFTIILEKGQFYALNHYIFHVLPLPSISPTSSFPSFQHANIAYYLMFPLLTDKTNKYGKSKEKMKHRVSRDRSSQTWRLTLRTQVKSLSSWIWPNSAKFSKVSPDRNLVQLVLDKSVPIVIWSSWPWPKFGCIGLGRPTMKFGRIQMSWSRSKFGRIQLSRSRPKFDRIQSNRLQSKFGCVSLNQNLTKIPRKSTHDLLY